jgi:hypothetical protein
MNDHSVTGRGQGGLRARLFATGLCGYTLKEEVSRLRAPDVRARTSVSATDAPADA